MAQDNRSIQNEFVAESVTSKQDVITSAIAEASASAVATAESIIKSSSSTVAASSETGSEMTKARAPKGGNEILTDMLSIATIAIAFTGIAAVFFQVVGF